MSQVVESYTDLIRAFQKDDSNPKWTEETQKRYKVEVDKILFKKDTKNEMKTNDMMNEMINKINEVVANIMDKRYERFTKLVDHFKSLYGEKKDDEEEENNEKNKLNKKKKKEIKMGSEGIQFLAYSDDIILLAKNPKTLKNMMEETKSFLDEKEAKINTQKSKILIFEKDGEKKVGKTEHKFKWDDIDMEEVEDYKYLGFQFRKNGDPVEQINNNLSTNSDTDDFAIWEFGKTREMDNITDDYLKRIPDYIKRDETSRKRKQNKIVEECWKELKEKNKNDLQKWKKCKHLYYKTKGIDIERLELIVEENPDLKQDLLRKRKTEQEQGHK